MEPPLRLTITEASGPVLTPSLQMPTTLLQVTSSLVMSPSPISVSSRHLSPECFLPCHTHLGHPRLSSPPLPPNSPFAPCLFCVQPPTRFPQPRLFPTFYPSWLVSGEAWSPWLFSSPLWPGLLDNCSLHPSSCTMGNVVFLKQAPPQPQALAPLDWQQIHTQASHICAHCGISLTSCLHTDYTPASLKRSVLPSNAQRPPAFISGGHQPSFLPSSLGDTIYPAKFQLKGHLFHEDSLVPSTEQITPYREAWALWRGAAMVFPL